MGQNIEQEIQNCKKNGKIIIFIICSLIMILVFCFILFKSFIVELAKKDYYYIDITENNRSKIIELLEERNIEYCESIYKIEFMQNFPDDKSGEIYCLDKKNIYFIIDDSTMKNDLVDYIKNNGVHTKE